MHSSTLLSLAYLLPLAAAHCKVSNSVGDLGGAAVAFGISGNKADSNSQKDVTVFKGNGGFGATRNGAIDPNKDIAAVQQISGNTLPQVSDGGQLTVTVHQVNADGAGPMACSIDTAASGNFQDLKIVQNMPGDNGRSNAANQDFPVVVEMPAGTKCTGTVGNVNNVCLVKCQNPAGPFGGTVPIQIGGGAAGGANNGGNNGGDGGNAAAAGGNNADNNGGNNNNNGGNQANGNQANGNQANGNQANGNANNNANNNANADANAGANNGAANNNQANNANANANANGKGKGKKGKGRGRKGKGRKGKGN